MNEKVLGVILVWVIFVVVGFVYFVFPTNVCGDGTDFDSCSKKAGWITPVPGGVGPVTVSCLMRNTVSAAQKLKSYYEAQFQNSIDAPF